jgi:hypothetical protein
MTVETLIQHQQIFHSRISQSRYSLATKYPSPKTSCPISPTFQVLSKKTSRKAVPNRSISVPSSAEEKYLQGIVNLDVYKEYLANPKSLIILKPKKEPTRTFDFSNYKNTKGAPMVVWKKGGVLNIPLDSEMYDDLTFEEIQIASILRVLPSQYLHIKETMLTQVLKRGPFKKRDAKSWFRIDVNKVIFIDNRLQFCLIGFGGWVGSQMMMIGKMGQSKSEMIMDY